MTFSALLLAGGGSRRMGRDKAMIEIDAQPLWKRQVELLRSLGPEKILVSARTSPAWIPDDACLVLDDRPSRGPISGLAKTLAAMATTHLIVLAVDMPFMTSGELDRLRAQATGSCGVVPIIGDRAEPLAAIYPAEAASDFEAALGSSDFSLQPLVRKLAATGKIQLLSVANEVTHLYRSVNEPNDFPL